MHYTSWLLAAAATIAGAQEFSSADYPSSCGLYCGPVASYATNCISQYGENSQALNCLCTGPDLASTILYCEECVYNVTGSVSGGQYPQIGDLRADCGFPDPLPEGSSTTTAVNTISTATTTGLITSTGLTTTTGLTTSTGNSTTATTTTSNSTTVISTATLTTKTSTTSASSSMTSASSSSSVSSSSTSSANNGMTGSNAVPTPTATSSSATSGNMAIATAAPVIGAGAVALFAAVAAL